MTKSVMMFLAFLLILPILPWLPLGISLKGKLIIAFESLAIASGIMLAVSYLPWWQGILIGLLIFIMAGYFTLKYGLPVWATEVIKVEEEERVENTTKKRRLSFSKKVEEKPEMPLHIEKKATPVVLSSIPENHDRHDVEQEEPKVLTKEEDQEVQSQEAGHEDDDLKPLEELSWANEQAEQQETDHEKEEDVYIPVHDIDLEEEDLLAQLESVDQVQSIEEVEHETPEEDSEGWLEVRNMDHKTNPPEDMDKEEDLYLQELFEEESAALDQLEDILKEDIGMEREEDLPLLDLEEEVPKEKDHPETDYLAELFEDDPANPAVDEEMNTLLDADKIEPEELPSAEDVDILPVLAEWKEEKPEADSDLEPSQLAEAMQQKIEEEETDSRIEIHEEIRWEEPSERSEEEPDQGERESLDELLPERPLLSAEWLQIIMQEIAVKQKALPYREAEELMLKYLNAPLHDRDYYTIARMLVAFYAANGETLQAMLFTDVLKERLQEYPALVEEIESIKEFIIKQSMETGE